MKVEDKVKILQEKIGNSGIWNYRISNINESGVITIIGASDLSYHYDCEIIFKEVEFISCPLDFSTATFRIATKEERELLNSQYHFEWRHLITCIVVDEDIDPVPDKFYIFSKDIDFNFETKYY